MRRVVGLQRPDVAPVAVEAVLARRPALDQRRQQPVPEVLQALLAGLVRQLLEQVEGRQRVEDEDLVAHQVVRRLVGLELVRGDPAVLHLHDAVPGGVLRGTRVVTAVTVAPLARCSCTTAS